MTVVVGIFLALTTLCVMATGATLWRREWRDGAKWAGMTAVYFAMTFGLLMLDLWTRGEL